MSDRPLVLVVMGSETDLPSVQPAVEALAQLGIAHEVRVASAHRAPEKAAALAREARGRGIRAIIAAAGWAAHLAGAMAASTTLPVIGLPVASGPLQGLDALLATVQMPNGVPVATVAIGGARNAAILAAEIIATTDAALAAKLEAMRKEMVEQVEAADAKARGERR